MADMFLDRAQDLPTSQLNAELGLETGGPPPPVDVRKSFSLCCVSRRGRGGLSAGLLQLHSCQEAAGSLACSGQGSAGQTRPMHEADGDVADVSTSCMS